jgi:hypothetical protein
MKKITKIFVIMFTVILLTNCYDRSIIDSKSFGVSLPEVENLNYTKQGNIVKLTWQIPVNISSDFKRPVEVSIQVVENNIYRNIISVFGENTSVDITIDEAKNYRFVVKLLGYLTDEAKIEGRTDKFYSESQTIEIK